MRFKLRIIRNVAAAAGSIGWSVIIQLLSVPVLITIWGAPRYGLWLMLSSIPSYFVLSDLGFSDAATADMTMAVARGDRLGALHTFHSIWCLVLALSGGLVLLATPLLIASCFVTSNIWLSYGATLFLLVMLASGIQFSRVILSAHRSTGHYAFGTMVYDIIQFCEGASVLVVAYLGGGFAACAAGMLCLRITNCIVLYILLRHKTPWLYGGTLYAQKSEFKRLLHPAIAAATIPLALAINFQGMILVAGFIIGPVAAAMLGSVRTVSRIAVQAVGIINRATMPEISAARGRNSSEALRKLVSLNLVSVMFVLLPGSCVFALTGVYLVRLWTHGHIEPSWVFVGLMAAGTFFNGCWTFTSNMLLAVGRLVKFSRRLVAISLVVVAAAIPVAHQFGLNGIAMTVLVAEFISALIALKIAAPLFRGSVTAN